MTETISQPAANTREEWKQWFADLRLDRTWTEVLDAVADMGEQVDMLAYARWVALVQAEDDALWCPVTVMEGYAVQELRTLTRAVEGSLKVTPAVLDV